VTLIIQRIDNYPRKHTSEKTYLPSFLFQRHYNCDRHPSDDIDDVIMGSDSDYVTRCRHTRTRKILLRDLRVCFLILRGYVFWTFVHHVFRTDHDLKKMSPVRGKKVVMSPIKTESMYVGYVFFC
jgi:hypothetical protein